MRNNHHFIKLKQSKKHKGTSIKHKHSRSVNGDRCRRTGRGPNLNKRTTERKEKKCKEKERGS